MSAVTLALPGNPAMSGYEIHLGVTCGEGLERGAVQLADGRRDGAISADDQIFATYCHGVFEHPEALTALLPGLGCRKANRSISPPAARPIWIGWPIRSKRRWIGKSLDRI
jgi:cobyric acid synthase